ncbi:MAG TPA: hypothetical protein VHX49_08850 [Candidatus Acidoferrales bacterium]|nr:hypothetical protein [Candidatus Acidoferrales bacterium]
MRPEQKLAVCTGSVPLSGEDRVEILAILAADADQTVSERAQNALLTQSAQYFLTAASRPDADPRLFAYCAENLAEKPDIANALAKNAACPTAVVTRVAARLTSEGIQALLDNLERFVSDPQLVLAVSASTAATAEQKALLDEMHKSAAAITEIEEAAVEIEPDPVKRESLMQRVAHMNVVQRLTLALKGGRSERMLLIRDPNKLIQRCVLQSPRLTDSEVEAFASMSSLPGETLRAISLNRLFMKNYSVVRCLSNNPKTPLDVSLHLLPRLNAGDLVKLGANKNVPETLRSSAVKLHRKRKLGG